MIVRLRLWAVIVLVLLSLSSCRSKYSQLTLDQHYVSAFSSGRIVDSLPRATLAHGMVLTLPDSIQSLSLSSPADVAAEGPTRCEFVISDRIDRAVHRFSSMGEYKGSEVSRRRHDNRFSGIADLAVLSSGDLVATYMGSRSVRIVQHSAVRMWDVPRLSDSMVPLASLQAVHDSFLAIAWFSGRLPTWSANWGRKGLPLVLLFELSGTPLARIGTVHGFPGVSLTAGLNRGFLSVRLDTLFFARAVDGVITSMVVPKASPGTARAVGSIAVPLLYRARTPMEFRNRSSGETFPQVEYHLTAFGVSHDGRYFILGQVVSWPDPHGNELYRPVTSLVAYDRHTGQSTLLAERENQRNEIVDLALSGDALIVIDFDARTSSRRAVLYPSFLSALPSSSGSPHLC